MQKEVTVKELEKVIDEYGNSKEPIIVKRDNESDLIILSLDEYNKRLFFAELEKEIDESEEDIKNGNVFKARDVFEELRQEYGY